MVAKWGIPIRHNTYSNRFSSQNLINLNNTYSQLVSNPNSISSFEFKPLAIFSWKKLRNPPLHSYILQNSFLLKIFIYFARYI